MTPARYRKKPVEIEAVRWDGIASTANEFLGERFGVDWKYEEGSTRCIIPTLEGDMCANVGDWIIRGVKGEFYPCKPDIFEATYEAATEPQRVIRIVFEDATMGSDPAPELRFVEVENERGESINIGRWHEGDGMRWLTIDLPAVAARDPLAMPGLDRHKHGFVP